MYNMTTSIKKITWCCGVLLLWMPAVWGNVYTVEYYATAYGVPDASVTQAECQAYHNAANGIGARTIFVSGWTMYPKGCWQGTTNPENVYFNTHEGGADLCGSSNAWCIKTKIKKQLMFPTFEKASGAPLAGEFKLTEAECEQYAMSVGGGIASAYDWENGNPSGCHVQSGAVYFNRAASSTDPCSDSKKCIHKAPFELLSGAARDVMSQTECQAYAAGNGYTFGVPSITFSVWSAGLQTYYKQSVAANRYYTGYYWAIDCGTNWFSTTIKDSCSSGYGSVAKTSVTPVIHSDRTFSSEEDPSGCFLHDGHVYFNTNSNSNACGGSYTCLSFRPNADARPNAYVYTVSGYNDRNDLSMTEAECQTYGAFFDPVKQYSRQARHDFPGGCIYLSDYNRIIWNPLIYSSTPCSPYDCLQKPVVFPKVWEISSGPPDLSINPAECEAYAKSIGAFYQGVFSFDNEPLGCYRGSSRLGDGDMAYNIYHGGGPCTSTFICFQKIPAMEEVTSGAPDLSMSQAECEAYGVSIGKWDSAAGSSGNPKGCFDAILEGGTVRYNNDASGGDCDVSSYYRCIQKVKFLNVPGCVDRSYATLGNYNPDANEDDNSCACINSQRSEGACVCLAGYYHNVAADTCNEKFVCTTPGYYTKDNGVADSECAPCTGQTWDNNNPAASACTAHTVTDSNKQTQCSVTGGETDVDGLEWFQFTPGSSTTDSSCSQCPTGYEASVLTTLASGTSCDKCAAGYGNDGTGNGCALCVASKYNPGYTSLATYCADKACSKGQGIGNAQGSDEIDDCVSCTAGVYSTSETTGQCQVCDDTQNKQTQTSQVVGGSHVVNSAHYCIDCPVGYDNSNGGECDPCVSGKWSVQGGTCNDWDTCASGKYSTTTPSSTVNRNCQTFSLQQENVFVAIGAEYADRSWASAVGKMLTTDGTTWVDVPVGAVRTGEDTWATGNAAIESAWYSHAYCDSQAKAEENYHPDDPVSATPAALDATKVGLILATNDPIAWYQPQVGKVYLGNGVFLDCPIYSMRVGNSCSDQKAAFENAWDSQCA